MKTEIALLKNILSEKRYLIKCENIVTKEYWIDLMEIDILLSLLNSETYIREIAFSSNVGGINYKIITATEIITFSHNINELEDSKY